MMYEKWAEQYTFSGYGQKFRFTVANMAAIARRGSWNPIIRETAVRLTSALPERDYRSEYRALHQFVRDRIRFIRDTANAELLQTPDTTLRLGAGDCDDKTTLLCSLLLSIGQHCGFSTIKTEGHVFPCLYPFSHVYPVVYDNGRWVALECVRPVDPGVEAEYTLRKIYVLS